MQFGSSQHSANGLKSATTARGSGDGVRGVQLESQKWEAVLRRELQSKNGLVSQLQLQLKQSQASNVILQRRVSALETALGTAKERLAGQQKKADANEHRFRLEKVSKKDPHGDGLSSRQQTKELRLC